jgi:hypothetical protein
MSLQQYVSGCCSNLRFYHNFPHCDCHLLVGNSWKFTNFEDKPYSKALLLSFESQAATEVEERKVGAGWVSLFIEPKGKLIGKHH